MSIPTYRVKHFIEVKEHPCVSVYTLDETKALFDCCYNALYRSKVIRLKLKGHVTLRVSGRIRIGGYGCDRCRGSC